ncbi:MAG: diguanylate cyclase, partial [Candidatus Omnitrophota bacterium]
KDKVKILVVDDEEVMRSLLTDLITDIGYEVRAVATGIEALEKAKTDGYAVIITDLKMPGMGGLELLEKVKAINMDVCIIVITAYPSVESAAEAIREGAYDYITKPFNIEEIKVVLRRAVERHYLLKEAEQKEFYQELSILDDLTGIYNHRHFHDVLPREIARAKRYSQSFSLLMIDIDDFKKYNDTHGHLAGDELLKKIAKSFMQAVRSVDMVFRYGGEEFVILLPQASKQNGAEICKRIHDSMKQKLPVTVSIGLAGFPEDGTSKDELIEKIDSAMYQAKRLGKDRSCIFGEED